MYDYTGDMRCFEIQLEKAGISSEELDITLYAGLTARQLQDIVDNAIANKKATNTTKCD